MEERTRKKVRIKTRTRKKRNYFSKLEWKWALIISLFHILWVMMEYEWGWHDKEIQYHRWLTMLVIIPGFLLYLLALKDKKQTYFSDRMKWKHGFRTGLSIAIITSVIASISQVFIHYVVTPHFFENAINYAVEHEEMSLEKAQSYFNLKTYMLVSGIGTFVSGVILSAICALIVRNR